MSDNENIREFHRYAKVISGNGSPRTAAILRAIAAHLDPDSKVGKRVHEWPGHAGADVLPLRVAGALHALARQPGNTALARAYGDGSGLEEAVAAALAEHDDFIAPWLEMPPQTNEVGRASALAAGLLAIAARTGPAIELLELGTSAGLNLNLDRFHIRLGEHWLGPEDSPVRLAPAWEGAPLPGAPGRAELRIVERAGVDLNPLDVRAENGGERLMAFIWPDQAERIARTEAAIGIARSYPPPIEQGDAAAWLAKRLAKPQAAGVTRVVMHSVFWQYLPRPTKTAIRAAMQAAGEAATPERPLSWMRLETSRDHTGVVLEIRTWPGGEDRLMAETDSNGAAIRWLG